MSTSDIVDFVGKLFAAWCIGFSLGYVMTKFKDAISQSV